MKLLPMMRTTILVPDKAEAVAFYAGVLGFEVSWESGTSAHVVLSKASGTGIWIIETSSEAGRQRIGDQTAGSPTMVLYTDDCKAFYERLREDGVTITVELTGQVETDDGLRCHFRDPFGNEIVLVQLQ